MKRQLQIGLGVLVSLIGGFLMYDGSILGEGTTGIARMVGIIGLVIITSSETPALAMKGEEGI